MKFKFLLFFNLFLINGSKCCNSGCSCRSCNPEYYNSRRCNSNKKNNNKTNWNKKEEKYYLNSDYDIDLPLNVKWSNCNCAILSIIRLLLSDKDLLDRILSKKISNYAKNKPNYYQIVDKTSYLFKEILKNKKDHNEDINEILQIYFGEKLCNVLT